MHLEKHLIIDLGTPFLMPILKLHVTHLDMHFCNHANICNTPNSFLQNI